MDGTVRCTRYALIDDAGRPVRAASQGQPVHLFAEFEVEPDGQALAAWLELFDTDGRLVHGRTSFLPLTTGVFDADDRRTVRARHTVYLDVAPGEYTLAFGLSSAPAGLAIAYANGSRDFAA